MSTHKLGGVMLCAALLSWVGVTPASASSFTFNFNTLASGAPSSGGVGATASIQNYMNNILGCTCVTVTGAIADQTYTGEGHVVGPGGVSLTLGNSNGATSNSSTTPGALDTFIANTSDGSDQISNQITMIFSGLTLNGAISFDYEIFPDGSGEQPGDFTFNALNSSDAVVSTFTQLGATPSSSGANGDGTSVHSPDSGLSSNETSAQWIGTYSTTLSNVTQLQFVDWPATIGIDNLSITNNNQTNGTTPEPASLVLLGSGLFGLAGRLRKKAATKTQSL